MSIAAPVRASPASDTSHGRLEGDVSLAPGAGVVVAPRAPRAVVELRARYVEAVGVFVSYEDALGQSAAEPTRVLGTGVELRPLFFGRWLKGIESGASFADLLVDSLGLELGAAFAKGRGTAFGARPALQAGLGLELPILAQAAGPWLGVHGGVRFGEAAMSGATIQGPMDRSGYLALTLSWHTYVDAHLVDASDRRVGSRHE